MSVLAFILVLIAEVFGLVAVLVVVSLWSAVRRMEAICLYRAHNEPLAGDTDIDFLDGKI